MSKLFKKISGVWTEQTPWSKIWKKTSNVWSVLYTRVSVSTIWSGTVGGSYVAPYGMNLTAPMSIDLNTFRNTLLYVSNYYNSIDGILYMRSMGESDYNEDTGKEVKTAYNNIILLTPTPIDLSPFSLLYFEIFAQPYTTNYNTVSGGVSYIEVIKVSDGMIMASWYLIGPITKGVYSMSTVNFKYPCYIRIRTNGRGALNGIETYLYKMWVA